MIAVGSAQDLLARASSRNRLEPADARAGAVFERVTVDGESFFVKRLSASSDWIMRIAGDHVHRPYLIWRSGIMNQAPGISVGVLDAVTRTEDGRRFYVQARADTLITQRALPERSSSRHSASGRIQSRSAR